ncbi:casein kinase I isoform alpha [Trichonephila inaurata madagascariensis]|uniref:Casein kinase I isoform alpha n=1 Tax=Trichonephila inaurata madagascariensis TaxID=2747483 RepID=A0A8X6XGU3_9ARAC|nr:casein kinase I isoform alpha [Trichonephila inaurata madagascariensis]
MPRNPDGIKLSTPNADNITAAAEAILKDGVPVRTAVRQFGVSRTTLQRHIAFCRKTNNSEIMESNCAYYNRCAVWTVLSKDEESALVQYLIVACNMHFELSKQVKKFAFEYAKANGKKYPKSWDAHGEAVDQWHYDSAHTGKGYSSKRQETGWQHDLRVSFKNHIIGALPGTVGTTHISGWSNAKIFVEFLKHFISHVKCSVNQPVLLLLDNHESHVSIEAITLAKEHGIVMLTFPPHTSHKLQPLDRGVFGPFKKYYSSACRNWMLSNPAKPIAIYDVAENVGKSYPLAFTPVNILAGFCVSGIWPVNPNIFTDDEYLSSSVTDRLDPSLNSQNNNFPEKELESSMMELNVYVSNSDISDAGPSTSNSVLCVTPEQIQPFPKAKS